MARSSTIRGILFGSHRDPYINGSLRRLHGGTRPLADLHEVDDDFLVSFMGLLISVARISDCARRTIIYAGYLDVMLSLAKQDFFLERKIHAMDVFRFPLDMFGYLQRPFGTLFSSDMIQLGAALHTILKSR